MNKISFENLPSTNTPVNATNLNQVQTNVENEFGNYYKLGIGSPIASGTDLNNMTTIGTYYSLTPDITNSLVNCPIKNAGFKLIAENTTGTNRIIQTIKVNNINTSETYVRTYTGRWGEWNIVMTGNYSTSERRIGTWIDGKPIYRKVVSKKVTTTGSTNIAHGINNIDIITNLRGFIYLTGGVFVPIPQNTSNGAIGNIQFWSSRDNIAFNNSISLSDYTVYFIFEYTKTTD